MKKLIILALLGLGIWVGINYVKTGKISILPVVLSAEEQELRDLQDEMASIDKQIAQESRAAGMTGMDTTMAVSRLMERKKKLEEKVGELQAKVAR